MRILQVISSHISGGAAAPALLLSNELRKRGHEVFFACVPGSGLAAVAATAGLKAVELPHMDRKGFIGYLPPLAGEIRRAVRREAVDIVHVHKSPEHLACCLADLGRAVLCRTCHAGERGNLGYFRGLLLRYSPGVAIAVSREAAEELRRAAGPRRPVSLIHGGVDEERFRPGLDGTEARERLGIPQGATVVGMVAKFSRERRIDVFLESVRSLDGCVGLLVGDGTRSLDPQRLGEEMGLGERLRVVNRAADFVGTVASIDIGVVLRSGSDGSCRAAMELMSMGKPVVLARRGFMKELVRDGVSGRLVSGDDPSELAAAVREIASDGRLAERLGAGARERILDRFTASAFAERHERLYLSLLGVRW